MIDRSMRQFAPARMRHCLKAAMTAMTWLPGVAPKAARWPVLSLIGALVLGFGIAPALPVQAQDAPSAQLTRGVAPGRGPVTNLPLPRYVSLKGGEGNARRGPSLSHRIDWVFKQSGMPLRVVAEYGHWRRVEDRDGAGGWVYYSLLSGVRTVEVVEDMAPLYTRASEKGDVVARAEAGAVLKLGECEPDWCSVSGGGASGWMPKAALWGVDPDEAR